MADEKRGSNPGLLDMSNRVLRELLRTPKFKAQVKIIIASLDPPAAAELVRTLMWEDPELFLDLVGVAPELVNAFLVGTRAGLQEIEKYPPPLLASFLTQIIEKLDAEALGALLAALPRLYRQLQEVPEQPLQQALTDFGRRVCRGAAGEAEAGPAEAALNAFKPLVREQVAKLTSEAAREGSETQKLIQGLSRELAAALKENPGFVTHVCKPFVDALKETYARE